MDAVVVNSLDFASPQRSVVDTAADVATATVRALLVGAPVVVSVRGLRGVSSSFFNIVLSEADRVLKGDFSENRLRFEFDNDVQRLVFERSKAALHRKAI